MWTQNMKSDEMGGFEFNIFKWDWLYLHVQIKWHPIFNGELQTCTCWLFHTLEFHILKWKYIYRTVYKALHESELLYSVHPLVCVQMHTFCMFMLCATERAHTVHISVCVFFCRARMCVRVSMCVYSHVFVRVRMYWGSEFVSVPGWLLLAGLATGQDVQ